MRDTAYLMGRGFKMIDIVDSEPYIAEVAQEVRGREADIRVYVMPYQEFPFSNQAYDLVNAQNAIPFAGDEHIDGLMESIKCSIKPGGIFCGTFFGPKDDWAGDPEISIKSLEWVKKFFNPQEWLVHKIAEEISNRPTANGNDKQWHIMHVIAARNA